MSGNLHSDIVQGVNVLPPMPTQIWGMSRLEMDPASVARMELKLENRKPINCGHLGPKRNKAGLTIWHRMLGRTYCLA
jgi:hypothetical protein